MEAGEVFIYASTVKRLDQPICRLKNLPLYVRSGCVYHPCHACLLVLRPSHPLNPITQPSWEKLHIVPCMLEIIVLKWLSLTERGPREHLEGAIAAGRAEDSPAGARSPPRRL
jgi:hypothetical protein